MNKGTMKNAVVFIIYHLFKFLRSTSWSYRSSGVTGVQTIVLKVPFSSVCRGWKYCLNSWTPVTPELHQLEKVESFINYHLAKRPRFVKIFHNFLTLRKSLTAIFEGKSSRFLPSIFKISPRNLRSKTSRFKTHWLSTRYKTAEFYAILSNIFTGFTPSPYPFFPGIIKWKNK